ncbi:RNA recognition motif-containing protein [Prochlorococcus sp. MIT 1223]|uniref:RNA recognition motif-containing protein n=1 Tax=Prochlorococcus sp. MIT 1223 TaxID=3096217 RepID=UPI002A74A871|nr:RNA recognition motif-containing protein [Prochlorococcus sp. MIT 1223]
MTTLQKPDQIISDSAHDALIDQLRASSSKEEILKFENWFNSKVSSIPLHELICELLRNRSISRVLAAKWLSTLINDKEEQLSKSN